MENLQITKKLKAFWKRSAYACVMGIGILSMNGCSKAAEEQIKPRQVQVSSSEEEYNIDKQENFEEEGVHPKTGHVEKPYSSGNDLPVVDEPWNPQIPSGN